MDKDKGPKSVHDTSLGDSRQADNTWATLTNIAFVQYKEQPDKNKRIILEKRIRNLKRRGAIDYLEVIMDDYLSYEFSRCEGKLVSESKDFYDVVKLARNYGLGKIANEYIMKKVHERKEN